MIESEKVGAITMIEPNFFQSCEWLASKGQVFAPPSAWHLVGVQ